MLTLNARCLWLSRMIAWVYNIVCSCLCLHWCGYSFQDCVSRPSSQMSHAASSGYGSARSTNRTMAEVVNADDSQAASTPLGQTGRSRNSLLNSLRKPPKVADAAGSLFRSLRVPRVGPSSATPGVDDSGAAACQSAQAVSLPLKTVHSSNDQQPQHDQQNHLPVPAPRFHTLKRHAYQNIPLPLKKTLTLEQHLNDQQQFMQVRYLVLFLFSFSRASLDLFRCMMHAGYEHVFTTYHSSFLVIVFQTLLCMSSAGTGRHLFCQRCNLYQTWVKSKWINPTFPLTKL